MLLGRMLLARQDDARMLTGSGDQCVHLWDTATARGLGQFRGHAGSVKSVCPHPTAHALFASGAGGRAGTPSTLLKTQEPENPTLGCAQHPAPTASSIGMCKVFRASIWEHKRVAL